MNRSGSFFFFFLIFIHDEHHNIKQKDFASFGIFQTVSFGVETDFNILLP